MDPSPQALGLGTACQVTLRVPAAMRAPIYLYYELDNFYQNHRRWVLLRSPLLPGSMHQRADCVQRQLFSQTPGVRPAGM